MTRHEEDDVNRDSDRLPIISVSSSALGARKALGQFQEATRDAFAAIPFDTATLTDFRLDLRAMHLGCLVLVECNTTPQRFERSRRMVATTGIDHLLLQLYLEGGSAGIADGRDVRVRAGDIWFFDLTRPRETRSGDFRNVTLVVPRALLEKAGADVDTLHGMVLRREQASTRILANHIAAVVAHAPGLTHPEADLVSRSTVALIVGLLDSQASGGAPAPGTSPLRAVLRHIDANLHDPALGPEQLMTMFGLSRAALYRMFRDRGGVADHIRHRRLRGAAIELGSTSGRSRRISEVARAWGFADDSSFSRAFRTHFGITPSAARSESAVWSAMHADSGDSGNFAQWLRTLRR